jgi:hypothetical protein
MRAPATACRLHDNGAKKNGNGTRNQVVSAEQGALL